MGVLTGWLLLLPSWPRLSAPQATTVPDEVTARLNCWPTASRTIALSETVMPVPVWIPARGPTPESETTRSGGWGSPQNWQGGTVPRPSAPFWLLPQAQTLPAEVTAYPKLSPAATAVAPVTPGTAVSTPTSFPPLLKPASWNWLPPSTRTLPSALMSMVSSSPALIVTTPPARKTGKRGLVESKLSRLVPSCWKMLSPQPQAVPSVRSTTLKPKPALASTTPCRKPAPPGPKISVGTRMV